jgi:hypothetical protein
MAGATRRVVISGMGLVTPLVGIMRDVTLHTEAARVAAFQAKGLGDRATYFRWRKKLQAAHAAPR